MTDVKPTLTSLELALWRLVHVLNIKKNVKITRSLLEYFIDMGALKQDFDIQLFLDHLATLKMRNYSKLMKEDDVQQLIVFFLSKTPPIFKMKNKISTI